MKIYLVGGAVRDRLLGLPVKENDWVVVGATPDEMLKLKYRSVGKDFPVFLHPDTQEEYALARKERKVRPGYTGFQFDASQDVTLKEDLMRRDLTINAMAEDNEGKLIDYYSGKADLAARLLRHVSDAFVEDPVRILRVARFAARFAYLNFTVAPETNELMKEMVLKGEVDALVPERVWKELERALGERNPEQFFIVLGNCEALEKLFPELTINLNEVQKEVIEQTVVDPFFDNQPILFAGKYSLVTAAQKTEDKCIRFAALLSDLTRESVKQLCERYRVPNEYNELAIHFIHLKNASKEIQNEKEMTSVHKAEWIHKFFLKADAFRRPERFAKLLLTGKILGLESISLWEACFNVAKKVNANEFTQAGIKGKEIGDRINQARIAKIQAVLEQT